MRIFFRRIYRLVFIESIRRKGLVYSGNRKYMFVQFILGLSFILEFNVKKEIDIIANRRIFFLRVIKRKDNLVRMIAKKYHTLLKCGSSKDDDNLGGAI